MGRRETSALPPGAGSSMWVEYRERVGIRMGFSLGLYPPCQGNKVDSLSRHGGGAWGGIPDLQCPERMGRGLGPGLHLWRAHALQASAIATTQHLSLSPKARVGSRPKGLKNASS